MLSTSFFRSALLATLAFSNAAYGLEINIDDDASVKQVAATIAKDMMSYYHGDEPGQIPGELPGPPPNPGVLNAGYFWWEAGAMWGALVDYWYYTGDDTYNQKIIDGVMFQVGENKDFQPQNQSLGQGNDDQAFWGMTAMTAAELKFPNPPANQPQWLALAQAVFNTQTPRWDSHCGGGLRWQANSVLNGFNYKNTISNGCYFNIAARLARYTSNSTYADFATRTFDWLLNVGFVTPDYKIYDGANIDQNCSDINPIQFSYNTAILLHGAAVMYNYTESDVWKAHLDGILNQTITTFFPNGIGYEVACEEQLTCNIDMFSMKAYLARWMAATSQLAPYTHDRIIAVMKTSAVAAAAQCCGGDNGRMCGLSWSKKGVWDGTSGVGQQMAALEVIQGTLIRNAYVPVTNSTGGISTGNPDAGIVGGGHSHSIPTIKSADRAGAGFLTALIIVGFMWMLGWMVYEPDMFKPPPMIKQQWPSAWKSMAPKVG